jgi:hypothetical protein
VTLKDILIDISNSTHRVINLHVDVGFEEQRKEWIIGDHAGIQISRTDNSSISLAIGSITATAVKGISVLGNRGYLAERLGETFIAFGRLVRISLLHTGLVGVLRPIFSMKHSAHNNSGQLTLGVNLRAGKFCENDIIDVVCGQELPIVRVSVVQKKKNVCVGKPSFLILDGIYAGLNHTKDAGAGANRTASKKPYEGFHFQMYYSNGDLRVVLDPLSRAQGASDFWPLRIRGKGNK